MVNRCRSSRDEEECHSVQQRMSEDPKPSYECLHELTIPGIMVNGDNGVLSPPDPISDYSKSSFGSVL